jgi:hypothetical protein
LVPGSNPGGPKFLIKNDGMLKKIQRWWRKFRGAKVVQEPLYEKIDNFGEISNLFSNIDWQKIDKKIDLEKIISDAIHNASEEVSLEIHNNLKKSMKAMLKTHKKERYKFKSKLHHIWGNAIDLLEALRVACLEAGEAFNEQFRDEAAKDENFVFDVLTHLHARACMIASEVIVLLRAGHASGAMARWRTMHEINIVALFINKHGNNVAERYLLSNELESLRAAEEQFKLRQVLGEGVATESDVQSLRQIKEKLEIRFGKDFLNPLGWASEILKNPRPKMAQLEDEVGLDHLKPYFRLSSHSIHAEAKGIRFEMGLHQDSKGKVMLAGPSMFGLADPGQLTANSLLLITTTTISILATLQAALISKTLIRLCQETCDEFINAHKALE